MDGSYREYLVEGARAGARYALASPQRTPHGAAGGLLGKAAGNSLEFMDHREYQPGDDLRQIDWSAFARSDKLNVKLYRQEVTPHLDIVIDGSQSMALESTDKPRATLALAALLATAAENSAYTHCAWLTGDGVARVANSTAQPHTWEAPSFTSALNPAEALMSMPPSWRHGGVRLLLSDLLYLGDPLATLSLLSQNSVGVVVVQVLASADAEPTHQGNLELVDCETNERQEIFIDASARARYRVALRRHQQNWNNACRQVGAVLTTIIAEDLCRNWRLDALLAAEILKVA